MRRHSGAECMIRGFVGLPAGVALFDDNGLIGVFGGIPGYGVVKVNENATHKGLISSRGVGFYGECALAVSKSSRVVG